MENVHPCKELVHIQNQKLTSDVISSLNYLPTLIRYHQMNPDLPTLKSDAICGWPLIIFCLVA